MRGLALSIALLAGCLGSSSHTCATSTESWLCPPNLACAAPPTYCGSPGLILQCDGKPEFDACTFTDTEAGTCHGGVCTACTPDGEGCPLHGWTAMTSGSTANLTSVWIAGRGDVYAGGEVGTMLHYDGLAWSAMTFPTVPQGTSITGLWGASPADIFAVSGAQIFHWDGSAWTLATTSTQSMLAITGAGGVVTVAGTNATVMQLVAGTWTTTENVLGLPITLPAAWAAGPDDVFVAGSAGTVLRLHGGTWVTSRAASGPKVDALSGTGGGDVIAVGDHGPTAATIYHYDGATWTPETLTSVLNFLGVWSNGGDSYACGQSGQIAHRTAGVWTVMTTPGSTEMTAITGTATTDMFAVGKAGAIWRYTGE